MSTLLSCNTIKQQPKSVTEFKPSIDSILVESSIKNIDSVKILFENPYQWISYRAKVDYVFDGNSGICNLYYVNRVDSIAYFNINISGIEIVRIVFTPKQVTYVNKLNKTYYQGSYFFIEKLAKMPIDFNIIQSIFNGEEYNSSEFESIIKDLSIQYLDYIPVSEYPFFSKMLVNSNDFSFQLDLKNIKFDTPGPTSITIPESFSKINFQPKL